MKIWRVGEIAQLTGLTVRTLHHYDEIGLLHPAHTSEKGHRLYVEDDLQRLHHIILLKQLGFSLEEVKRLMTDPAFNPLHLLEHQLARINEHIQMQLDLRDRLNDIYSLMHRGQPVDPSRFMEVVQMINISRSKHFSREMAKNIQRNYTSMNSEQIREKNEEFRRLISGFRSEMEKGTPEHDPVVLDLARRWKSCLQDAAGDYDQLSRSAESYYRDHSDQALPFGMDGELYQFIRKAVLKI
ncbi:DNA-binding transcriptional MerR regulator [Paenibacillus rhizosphaerae]|uniref:DNA-binding transcriptional MerR regulator n=1 Tax=Paenibacillus rhizosphaerae TaxID=297318 RepID=A0A839TRZ5_9BACL|nr:MerR family transcriptional regulator [Paenibacillus rhizosphaerae]MBB3129283.1 DNA-binding transcriptional MerR regulator [Paenibacillus rhizosphaerae]